MKIYDNARKELMNVSAISHDENNMLVVRGKIFGTMPMVAKLSPEEARSAIKLLGPGTLWFLLTFLLRRSKSPAAKRPVADKG